VSPGFCDRQFIPDDVYAVTRLVGGDFQDLICKVGLVIKFFEGETEKKSLKFEVHPGWPIDTDKAGMEWNVCEHPF